MNGFCPPPLRNCKLRVHSFNACLSKFDRHFNAHEMEDVEVWLVGSLCDNDAVTGQMLSTVKSCHNFQ